MIKKIYQGMAAMNTGLFLLFLLGLSSALGSAFLPEQFYRSWVFILLLAMLSLNLSLCTINQLLKFSRILAGKPKPGLGLLRKAGLLILHAGMVFILLGGFLQIFCGQQTQISLAPQESIDISKVMQVNHPFTLSLNDFQMRYNQDGSVSQYYAYATVMEKDQSREFCIRVNHPLQYKGVKAYQMSFGNLIKVKINRPSGEPKEGLYQEGAFLDVDQSPYRLKIYRYLPSFDPALGMNSRTLRPDNPRIVFSVYKNGHLKGVGAARFHEQVKLDQNHTVVFQGVMPYTVLKLKSDPGLPSAWAGGMLTSMGFFMYWISSLWIKKKASMRQKERQALVEMLDNEINQEGCER